MNNKKFYYQDYAKTLGNFDAGVILHKLHSWHKCMKDKRYGGIFYKSRPELSEETGLSIQRIRSATKFLVQNGWIEITVKGAPPTCWYKVNHDKIMFSLDASENTYPLDFTQLVADCDVQVIDYSQNVAPTFQNVAPTFPYQYIHNLYEETDTSYPKERENTSYFLHAERETQNHLAAETKNQPITESVMSTEFESLVAALAPIQPIVDSKPKPTKPVRQRSAKEQVMISAKQAPDNFSDDQAQAYRDWVQHASAKKISSAAMQAQKDLLTKLHQEGYDIIKIINHYLLLDIHRLKEDDIRQAFPRQKPKPTSNVIPLQQAKRREPTMGWV